MYDIIKNKRDGHSLSEEEINFFIREYSKGTIPDYQVSSLLMAIFLNKMNEEETLYLTKAIIESGETVDLSGIEGVKVDKHSTGGVGDKTTLILGPMIAACGVPFVKMSGRGLGHTGGTLDKLEAIENFKVDMNKEDFIKNVNDIGISIASQTANITPADKKLYALRDVTATVDNISLIASSIMGKKLAIKSDGIILDVKVGSGAFMKDIESARELAREMVNLGNNYGRNTIALITNMEEPLGNAIGNALEVKEAIDVLRGNGPSDIYELCLVLGVRLLRMAKPNLPEEEAKEMLIETIRSKKAYYKLVELVKGQHGDSKVIEDPSLLPQAEYIIPVVSKKKGYIKSMDAEEIGKCALALGAGRETMDSLIDLSSGIVLNKKIDSQVEIGETLAYVHCNEESTGKLVAEKLLDIFIIGEKNIKEKMLILDEIV